MTAMAGYGEVVVATIRAKSGSFPSIVVMGRLIGLPAVTQKRGGVRTIARVATELRGACGYDQIR